MKSFPKTLLILIACFLLAACSSSGTSDTFNIAKDHSDRIDSALERAALSSAAQGHKGETLAYLEKIYKRKSTDPTAAMNYAAGLREADQLNRAILVLRPFAENSETDPNIKLEFCAIQLALGNTAIAEEYARKVILLDPENFKAYHYLGIALDAQGMHEDAERAFRNGLDRWQGDPIPIMNNLALNLTSQGFLDEAAEILLKAKAVAPNRLEVERNLRIVMALQQSHGGEAPKPSLKPKSKSSKLEF